MKAIPVNRLERRLADLEGEVERQDAAIERLLSMRVGGSSSKSGAAAAEGSGAGRAGVGVGEGAKGGGKGDGDPATCGGLNSDGIEGGEAKKLSRWLSRVRAK
jgi:hypothetical protein